ncbi:response regulator [Cohnella panacarvi]|uniref:response regulator n=1 Tax=Cohnella panacarvi TaxID=400776 RepID=UPI0004B49E08|nr:response regulator [Cohnella panacarvi]
MHLILRKMLAKLPGIQVAGAFRDAESALAYLRVNPEIGLVFADISMQGENGLMFAAKLEALELPVQVVFVTSHKEFALEAYDLTVLDYLVKPVSQERLARTVQRALTYYQAKKSAQEANAAPTEFVVTALGDMTVSNGTSRIKWISRKCTELFAYLLLYRGKRIPRSRLLADIFGDSEQSAGAVNYLNTTVYQLRKSLESLGVQGAIRSENDGYALDWKEPVIDFADFEREVEALPNIDASNIDRAIQTERRYTGELFGDKAYVWATSETERYAGLYASFAQRLALAHLRQGDPGAASKLLLKLNQHDPFDESVVRQLIAIRNQQGDRKGMSDLYRDYVKLLDQELGIRPSEELTRCYESFSTSPDDV